MAYKAGFSLPDVSWPRSATDKQRTPGVHHNPFDLRVAEQRDEALAWLKGLKDRLAAPAQSTDEIRADVEAQLKDAS